MASNITVSQEKLAEFCQRPASGDWHFSAPFCAMILDLTAMLMFWSNSSKATRPD
jgi:hypothetical protein